MNNKGFAITGLVFIFVALIFGAANHIYFAHESKQKAINFAFMSDAVNSIAVDFPNYIADMEGNSISYAILTKAGCKTPNEDLFRKQIRQEIDSLNTMFYGTGIKIKINLDDYSIFPSPCPKKNPKYCGSVVTVEMTYTIETPYFERQETFSNQRSEVCTYSPLGG